MAVIRVQGTDVEVDARDDEPVLTALQRCGYSYIVGCKRGGCGICKLDLVQGVVEYLKPVAQSVLPDEDRATTALSCRSVPVSDIVLHMPEGSKFRAIAPFLASLAKAQAAQAAAARTTRDASGQAVVAAAAATAVAATGVAMNAAADAIEASVQARSQVAGDSAQTPSQES